MYTIPFPVAPYDASFIPTDLPTTKLTFLYVPFDNMPSFPWVQYKYEFKPTYSNTTITFQVRPRE